MAKERTKRSIAMRNKERGKDLERKVVEKAKMQGFPFTRRTWGSSGASLGLPADVDVVLLDEEGGRPSYLQCKKTKKIRKDFFPDKEHLEGVVIEGERTDTYIVVRLSDYLFLRRGVK